MSLIETYWRARGVWYFISNQAQALKVKFNWVKMKFEDIGGFFIAWTRLSSIILLFRRVFEFRTELWFCNYFKSSYWNLNISIIWSLKHLSENIISFSVLFELLCCRLSQEPMWEPARWHIASYKRFKMNGGWLMGICLMRCVTRLVMLAKLMEHHRYLNQGFQN